MLDLGFEKWKKVVKTKVCIPNPEGYNLQNT